jgi:protein pelota
VDEVLLADTLLRDPSMVPLLENSERMQAKIVVLSTEFEPGERLVALGGIAALLRYKLA